MRRSLIMVAMAGFLAASCGAGDGAAEPAPIRIVFVGDVMLGRGVAPVVEADPAGLFVDVRHVLRGADLAMANLESPLTTRPHVSVNPYQLEADPAAAALLAAAGFDVASLANNHAGDAGPASITDTVSALAGAGLLTVGAGSTADEATEPLRIDVNGLTVGVLAYDLAGSGLVAGDGPGVAAWDAATVEEAVRSLSDEADVVVVSLHGGVAYLPEADPRVAATAEDLVAWGADVVWGHGPHVAQPVRVVEDDPPALVATSLGNFLFDQRGAATGVGMVLEVLAGSDGVVAYRTGVTSHHDLRVHFTEWDLPDGDAVLFDGEWWATARSVGFPAERTMVEGFPWGDVVDAGSGDVTGSGRRELVVSFRHLPGPHPVRDGLPMIDWTDAAGRTAHVGIYREADLSPIWVAGMVPAPIADLAVCAGSVALAYSTLDDPSVIGTGAAVWHPFGLDASPRLPGAGIPGCVDIDGDGSTEPVIDRR